MFQSCLTLREQMRVPSGERRADVRTSLRVSGRYVLDRGEEFACSTIDISPGGLALQGAQLGKAGERCIAYLHELGRIEGVVVRQFAHGFALKLNVAAVKRERLAQVIARLVDRGTTIVS